jgi:hypothetical protein
VNLEACPLTAAAIPEATLNDADGLDVQALPKDAVACTPPLVAPGRLFQSVPEPIVPDWCRSTV